jgi:hypothetical protein
MAHIRIELDRGEGWSLRQEGEFDITADDLTAQLPGYCSQYPHRAFLDGRLIAEVTKPRHMKSKVVRF